MKTKRVTIKDIAELAGVSKATASLVLNGRRGKELRVVQETRERVLAIAREQHYQPSIHARSLRDNRSHTIGPGGAGDHQLRRGLSHELEMLCREAGVQLLISCTDENPGQESMVVNNMIARQVDGLIVASCMHSDADYLEAQRTAAGGAV